jgi:hypothetical protein
MRSQKIMLPLASALLAAVTVTLVVSILNLAEIEEPWNIVVVSEVLQLTRLTLVVALAHALVLGLPLFLILRSMRKQVGAVACALGGFLVGAVPIGLSVLSTAIGMRGPQSESIGGKATVINGVTTLAGWIEYAQGVGFWGSLGTAGGLSFWGAMRISGQIGGTPNLSRAQTSRSLASTWSIVFPAVLLTCAIFLLPSWVKDNSCHNLFRDRQIGINPEIYASIKLSPEDWPTLRQIFVDFGSSHSLSFRSDEQIQGGNILWRDLNLCNEAGINIDALDQPWAAQTNSPHADHEIDLSVFDLKAGSEWKPLARDLLNRIDMTWPQKTTLLGPDGKAMSIEEAVRGQH